MKNNLNILIAGEGGQGIQVIAKILTEAAFLSGKKVSYLPNFGVEQRGGVSLAFIQISSSEISFPKFQTADLVVLLSKRAIKRVANNVGREAKIIFDNSIIEGDELSDFRNEKVAIPASQIAKDELVPRVFNVIILGAIAEEIGIVSEKIIKKSIEKNLADKIKKKAELKHFNRAAFEEGVKIAKGLKG